MNVINCSLYYNDDNDFCIIEIVEILREGLVEKVRIDDVNYIHFSYYDDKDKDKSKVIERGN